MTQEEKQAILDALEAVKRRVTFEEEKHIYTLDNSIILPSVTQIMKPLSDQVYGNIGDNFLDPAKERGTAVHNAIELFEQHGWQTDTIEIQGYLQSYIAWRNNNPDKIPMCNEGTLYSPSNLCAGRFDFISENFGLWDLKTSGCAYPKLWGVQLSAYCTMIRELKILTPKYAGILQLHGNGDIATPIIYTIKELDDMSIYFLCCMKIMQFNK